MGAKHPGHVILRALVMNDAIRRDFVAMACAAEAWDPARLVRAIHADAKHAGSGPRNVTPAEQRAVRDFIESI